MFLGFWRTNRGFGWRLKEEVVDVFVDEEALVDKAITEPDIDVVELCDIAQIREPHFFPNLANCRLTIPLPRAYVPLGEGPFSV